MSASQPVESVVITTEPPEKGGDNSGNNKGEMRTNCAYEFENKLTVGNRMTKAQVIYHQ